MDMMKKMLFLAMTALVSLSALADDYPYLTFQTQDGTLTSVATSSLTLAIESGQLVVNDGEKTFTLTDLKKMYFSTDDATAIESLTDKKQTTAESGLWFTIDGRMLSGKPSQKGIYINNGRKVIIK
jgi:hypothetical protein